MNPEKKKGYAKKYYARDRQKIKAKSNARYYRHRKKILMQQRGYGRRNANAICEKVRRWKNEHPEKHRDQQHRARLKRGREKSATELQIGILKLKQLLKGESDGR